MYKIYTTFGKQLQDVLNFKNMTYTTITYNDRFLQAYSTPDTKTNTQNNLL